MFTRATTKSYVNTLLVLSLRQSHNTSVSKNGLCQAVHLEWGWGGPEMANSERSLKGRGKREAHVGPCLGQEPPDWGVQ